MLRNCRKGCSAALSFGNIVKRTNMRRTILWVISAVAILLTSNSVWPAGHEDLKATPGLWKITYRTQINGQPDPIIFKWRCVSEEQMDDPAAVFAKPAAA